MKSIYSLATLQRILDHWGIGVIEEVTYFQNVGRNVWRHFIETSQGEFELFSYPTETKEYSQQKLDDFLETHRGNVFSQSVHSFDRYHVLLQSSKKNQISVKHVSKDFDLLIGLTIGKAFRVYGTIFQIHLENRDVNEASVLVSYGEWRIQDGLEKVSGDTQVSTHDQLDEAIEMMAKEQPVITQCEFRGAEFKLSLSNEMSLYFSRTQKFPALEVHLRQRKNDILIYSEDEIYYLREF